MSLQKQYLYKISRNGTFLGVLQNVISQFSFNQLINTPGASMDITVGVSASISNQSVDILITESGDEIITESGDNITTERQPDIVGNSNSQSLIRSYNDIEVYEASPNNPNGKLVFKGYISKWKASFSSNDLVTFSVVSYGAELDNYLIEDTQSVDISQVTGTSTIGCFDGGSGRVMGETITPVAGSINAILIKASAIGNPTTVTVSLLDSVGGAVLASGSRVISSAVGTEYIFNFSDTLPVTVGGTYFFYVSATGDGINLYYDNAAPYAGGSMYTFNNPGPWVMAPVGIVPDGDLYFKTLYTSGATSTSFTTTDPGAILKSIVDSYVNRGGSINYAAGTVDLPGTSVSYTFRVNTILEGIQKCLELAPSDWYWYVDPGTNTLYFKETSSSADHTMILGRHIKTLDIEANVEQLKNVVYLSGGDTGSGTNLFTSQSDDASLSVNKRGLGRISDNRVTLAATADALMQNFLDENSSEIYNTTVEVLETVYDITSFKLGQNVGFGGFGNFVDHLLLQIVGITRLPDSTQLKLGVLPKRATGTIEAILRSLNDINQENNPSAPS